MTDTTTETVPPEQTAPIVDPAAPPPAAIEVEAPPPAPEPEPKPEHGNKGKSPWFLERIAQESAARRTAEEAAATARREAAEARELLDRLQRQPNDQTQPAPRQRVQEAPDFQTAVQQEAARQRLYSDSAEIKTAGTKAYGQQFGEALGLLTAIGATSDDFVSDLVATDKQNAHVIMTKLAADPELAANLVQMDSKRRIAELTRMSMAATATETKETKPAAPLKTVSKAPAPAPAITGSTSKTVDGYSDDASDDEFTAEFNRRMKERNTRR